MAHRIGGGHDGAADDVVGEIEQPADELSIAGHAFGTELFRAGRWLLQHEAAFGAGGNDHGILDDLCLDETQHLGAEILTAVAPTNAAACNPAIAQMDSLDARRAHPDLEQRPGKRHVGNLRAVELVRQHRSMATGVARSVGVGAQRGIDEGQQRTQCAIIVEARHPVERLDDRGMRVGLDTCSVADDTRVEARREQRRQLAADRRMANQRGFDVLLAEGKSDLAQVPRVGAEDLDLAGGHAGEQHESVESVDLHRSGELGEEAALHLGADRLGQLHLGRQCDTHVVEPYRCPVAPESEGSFVEGAQAEMIEQRQHVGQRDRLATSIDPESPGTVVAPYQIGRDLHGAVGKGVDVDEVERGNRRIVELVVACRHRRLEHSGQIGSRPERGSNCVEPVIGDVGGCHGVSRQR